MESVRIRKGLVESNELNPNQLRIYQVLFAFKQNNQCSMSYSELGKYSAISRKAVEAAAYALRTLGLITWEQEKLEDGTTLGLLFTIKDYRDWTEDTNREEVRGFFDLPIEILINPDITPAELRVIETFCLLGAMETACRITVRELVPLCAISGPTLVKVLKVLKEKKILEDDAPSTYKLNIN